MQASLVVIVFNRPGLTKTVFETIKLIKPRELFVISDGPRNEQEQELVQQSRSLFENIDWQCQVNRKFAESNLGCRRSVSEGLDWVFTKTDRAIILEDDCLPDPSFFPYCYELLEKYKNDDKVMMISGNNFFKSESTTSYGFCRHSLIWGWATWKRAWEKYRDAEKGGLEELTTKFSRYTRQMSPIRLKAIKKTLEGKIDTWDYIWQMAMLMNGGLCIYPKTNLVKNVGFGDGATHTKRKTFHSYLEADKIDFPLTHPSDVKPDISFDKKVERTYQPINMIFDIMLGPILRRNKRL